MHNELITSLSFNFCFLTSKVIPNYVISDISIGIGYPILDYKNIGYWYRIRISYQNKLGYQYLQVLCCAHRLGLISCLTCHVMSDMLYHVMSHMSVISCLTMSSLTCHYCSHVRSYLTCHVSPCLKSCLTCHIMSCLTCLSYHVSLCHVSHVIMSQMSGHI